MPSDPSDLGRGPKGDVRNMHDASQAFIRDILPGRSMRIFLLMAVVYSAMLIWLRHPTVVHFAVGWISIGVTLVAEAFNTTIEAQIDLSHPRLPGESAAQVRSRQPGAARIKHLAAAVVFVSGMFLTIPICALMFLYPR